MRYRLRTLLILLAVGPVVLAAAFWDRGIAVGLMALIVPVFLLAAIIEFTEERRTRRQ